VIVHGTNTLSYKVKICAKDQCFLRTLTDLKRDDRSTHNYFFKNGLPMVHGFPSHLFTRFHKISELARNRERFSRDVSSFSLMRWHKLLSTVPDVLDLRFRNWPETKTIESVFVAKGSFDLAVEAQSF
jgi:hypothetical protein